jgi:hypothetical protein
VKWFTIAFLGETQFGGAFLRLALSVALCFAVPFNSRGDAPSPSTNRFLFIIDTSAGMKKIDEPVREAVFDLIYSGVRGHMTNGDSYGVWLVDEQNDTSAGVEAWKQKFAVELAARAALRVKDHGFKGKCSLDVALADAARVASSVKDVTVVIVSNGETHLRGTPFDEAVNAQIAKLAPEMQKARLPINTLLVAQDGAFVAWAVNSPDFLVNMPAVPPRQSKSTPAVAQSTPSPDPIPTNKPVVAAAPRPRVAANPIIITRETVDREKQVMRALATTDPNAAPAPATNATHLTVTNVVAVASKTTNLPVTASTVPKTAITSAPVATPAIASAPPLPNLVTQPVPTTPPLNARTTSTEIAELPQSSAPAAINPVSSAPRAEPTTPAVPPATSSRIFLYGGVAVAGAFVLLIIVALIRRARTLEPSLITQAAALERRR